MVPTWSVTGDVKRYQMVMKCLPASSTVKLLFCPFLLYSLEASIKSGLSWEEGNNLSSWRGLCLRILLGFSVRKTGLFCPVYYLFVFIELCSFICVDSCLFILYFELQSHTRSCILLLRSVRLGPWRGRGRCSSARPFDMPSSFCLCITPFLALHDAPGPSFFSAPAVESATSPRSSGSF